MATIVIVFVVFTFVSKSIVHAQNVPCFSSEQEMLNSTSNMGNFTEQLCPDAGGGSSGSTGVTNSGSYSGAGSTGVSGTGLTHENAPHACPNPGDCTSTGQLGPTDQLNSQNAPHAYPSASVTDTSANQFNDWNNNSTVSPAPYDSTTGNDFNQFDQAAGNDQGLSIDVPLRDQNDPLNPFPATACGPTVLGMIADLYGINVSTPTLESIAGTNSQGTTIAGLISAAKQIGLTNIQSSEDSTVLSRFADNLPLSSGVYSFSTIQDAISAGHPALVEVDLDSYSAGHALVVTGISGGNVYVNNPWNGEKQVIGETQFRDMWGSRGYQYLIATKP